MDCPIKIQVSLARIASTAKLYRFDHYSLGNFLGHNWVSNPSLLIQLNMYTLNY